MFFIKLDTPLLFKKMKSIFIIVLVTKLKTRNNTGGGTWYTFNNMNASQNYYLSRRSQLEKGMYCRISFTTLQKMTANLQ